MANLPGVESGSVAVNGARLAYDVAGAGEPLVLVHAGIADRRMWDAQVPAFAARYRVIRYDMRGFGESPPVDGPYAHWRDLQGLLQALGIPRAHLLGCSIGGMTVLDLALAQPEVAASLILVNSGVNGYWPEAEPPRQEAELQAADERGDLARVCELEMQIWVDGPRRSPGQVDAAVRAKMYEMNLRALEQQATGLGSEQRLEPPAVGRLAAVRALTLVIVGGVDQPESLVTGDLLERQVASARKVIIPDVAHVPSMERPAEFNRLVLDFLAGI